MVRRNYFSDVITLWALRVLFFLVNYKLISIFSDKSLLLSLVAYSLICGGLWYHSTFGDSYSYRGKKHVANTLIVDMILMDFTHACTCQLLSHIYIA